MKRLQSGHLGLDSFSGGGFPEEPRSIAGYLDEVLAIFKKHNHPFVLVGGLGLRWNGVRGGGVRGIEVLLAPSRMRSITHDLVSTGQWTLVDNEYLKRNRSLLACAVDSVVSENDVSIWLKAQHVPAEYGIRLRFWPEDFYKLSVDCPALEVSDVFTWRPVVLEDEYYLDRLRRFGPLILPHVNPQWGQLLPALDDRCKDKCRGIPILVPRIESHLNALLDHWRLGQSMAYVTRIIRVARFIA